MHDLLSAAISRAGGWLARAWPRARIGSVAEAATGQAAIEQEAAEKEKAEANLGEETAEANLGEETAAKAPESPVERGEVTEAAEVLAGNCDSGQAFAWETHRVRDNSEGYALERCASGTSFRASVQVLPMAAENIVPLETHEVQKRQSPDEDEAGRVEVQVRKRRRHAGDVRGDFAGRASEEEGDLPMGEVPQMQRPGCKSTIQTPDSSGDDLLGAPAAGNAVTEGSAVVLFSNAPSDHCSEAKQGVQEEMTEKERCSTARRSAAEGNGTVALTDEQFLLETHVVPAMAGQLPEAEVVEPGVVTAEQADAFLSSNNLELSADDLAAQVATEDVATVSRVLAAEGFGCVSCPLRSIDDMEFSAREAVGAIPGDSRATTASEAARLLLEPAAPLLGSYQSNPAASPLFADAHTATTSLAESPQKAGTWQTGGLTRQSAAPSFSNLAVLPPLQHSDNAIVARKSDLTWNVLQAAEIQGPGVAMLPSLTERQSETEILSTAPLGRNIASPAMKITKPSTKNSQQPSTVTIGQCLVGNDKTPVIDVMEMPASAEAVQKDFFASQPRAVSPPCQPDFGTCSSAQSTLRESPAKFPVYSLPDFNIPLSMMHPSLDSSEVQAAIAAVQTLPVPAEAPCSLVLQNYSERASLHDAPEAETQQGMEVAPMLMTFVAEAPNALPSLAKAAMGSTSASAASLACEALDESQAIAYSEPALTPHPRTSNLDAMKNPLIAADAEVMLESSSGSKVCDFCGKVFPTARRKQYHVQQFHRNPPHICRLSGCGETFHYQRELRSHGRKKHAKIPLTCMHPDCGEKFASAAEFSNHIQLHIALPLACPFQRCVHRFESQDHQMRHVEQHRLREPYACTWPNCDVIPTSYSALVLHYRRSHTGYKPNSLPN